MLIVHGRAKQVGSNGLAFEVLAENIPPLITVNVICNVPRQVPR